MTKPLNLLINYPAADLDWEGLEEVTRPDDRFADLEQTSQWGSYVGKAPQTDAAEAAHKRHTDFAEKVAWLETVCTRYNAYDASGMAAQTSLRRRAGGLAMVKSSLAIVTEVAADDEELAPYLAGTYLWIDAVTDALVTVAEQLNDLSADWGMLRHRIAEVAWIYEMVLVEQSRVDSNPPADADLCVLLDDVMTSLVRFKVSLDEPFG